MRVQHLTLAPRFNANPIIVRVHCEAVAVLQVQIIPQYNIVGLNRGSGLQVCPQSSALSPESGSPFTVHCEAVAVLQVQIIPQYNIVGLNRGSGLRVSTQSSVLSPQS